MTWEVYLTGDENTLSSLSEALEGHQTCVEKKGRGFMLSSPIFDAESDADTIREQAAQIIDSINGIAAVLLSTTQRIELSHVEEISNEGKRNIIVRPEPATLSLSASVKVVLRDAQGNVIEKHSPADPASAWLSIAMRNAKASKALRLRGHRDLAWSDLYRLFEVIEEAAGGMDQLVTNGWASMAQIRQFKHTSGSVGAIGDLARHGKETTSPPARPMKLSQARDLIDRILMQWLNSL